MKKVKIRESHYRYDYDSLSKVINQIIKEEKIDKDNLINIVLQHESSGTAITILWWE
jgi:hypothetical protein